MSVLLVYFSSGGTLLWVVNPRSVTEFYGGIIFFSCTRHVSMYLCHGIVILTVLSHGVLFLLVSSAIDVATEDGTHAQ
jgi:hypothetical protein